ncbi:hypothetical protein EYF80_067380 [Liparis tanakae]|uniref:Uncharacterized protein n=1 Tax=Liparis tanakae TaxID=230148 RepID=A0A4Z2E1A4_9TELE|nr:hypothetical protein EYF80_067380 [Liparis tanakae]
MPTTVHRCILLMGACQGSEHLCFGPNNSQPIRNTVHVHCQSLPSPTRYTMTSGTRITQVGELISPSVFVLTVYHLFLSVRHGEQRDRKAMGAEETGLDEEEEEEPQSQRPAGGRLSL